MTKVYVSAVIDAPIEKVTNGKEADVVEAVGNGTFGKAFEVLNQHFGGARA